MYCLQKSLFHYVVVFFFSFLFLTVIVGVVVLTGKRGELFTVSGRGKISRLERLAPTGGCAPASASRRGGQSALRFSRLAESFRLSWVKKVVEAMNRALVGNHGDDDEGFTASRLHRVLVCGGRDLQTLLKSDAVQKEIHHTLRQKLMFVESSIDPTETQRGKKLRKVTTKSGGGGDTTSRGTVLLDHELRAMVVATLS